MHKPGTHTLQIEEQRSDNKKSQEDKPTLNWSVYILLSSDRRLYTGITNNMRARWKKHQQKKGAKFFHGRSPICLCYQEPEHTRRTASQREYAIKQLTRQQKWRLVLEHYGPHLPKP